VPNRRQLLRTAPGAALAALGHATFASGESAGPAPGEDDRLPSPIRALAPPPDEPTPIALDEHRARVDRARALLAETDLDAVVVGPGSSLAYFTGAQWHLSERFFGVVLTRSGDPVWVMPAFERDRGLEQARIGGDVRTWEEDASPFALLAGVLKDRGVLGGRIGVEETMPFGFSNGLAAAAPGARLVDAIPVTAGCRMVKDHHELGLMRHACALTLRAVRALLQSLEEGVTVEQAVSWAAAAYERLGVSGWNLVLFGPDAAYPHGTSTPRALQRGDVVLIDSGCSVHGYWSDITRTAVFGAPPTERQRRVWDLVRRAQRAAFEAARPGTQCQAIDAAARGVIDEAGFGPGYSRFTHRLGHGIGLDVHEWPYMVRGSTTRLRPGMTFTVEPGLYLRGELGVRHEDTVVVTGDGALNLAPAWSGTPEDPAPLSATTP